MIPIFKSHYSCLKSTLSLERKVEAGGAASIIDICRKNGEKEVYLVDENLTAFPEAYSNCLAEKLNLIYGLRITVCQDMNNKNTESLNTEHRYIIFAKNTEGLNDLDKIYSVASTAGFYYVPRIDDKTLKALWTDNLLLVIPFYDSFLYQNLLTTNICLPNFPTTPNFFYERNGLFSDPILLKYLKSYLDSQYKDTELTLVKSVYYENRDDFPAYLTLRCVDKKSTLDEPRLDGLTSDEFCFESYLDFKNKKTKKSILSAV